MFDDYYFKKWFMIEGSQKKRSFSKFSISIISVCFQDGGRKLK